MIPSSSDVTTVTAPVSRKKSSFSGKVDQKKPIPGPTTFKCFVQMLLLHFCKKYLLLDPRYRAGCYLIALTTVAVIFDVFPAPKSYFSDKDNALNQYFVKLGWGWTFCLVGPFIYLTSRTYCCGDMAPVKRHLSRLLVGTCVWYVWVRVIFHHVEHTTGICASTDHSTKPECVAAGFQWFGFDISGHTFILTYCVLIIVEETQVFKHWERITDAILNEEETMKKLSVAKFSTLKEQFFNSNANVKIIFVALTCLCLIWELMLLMTIIYFHTVPQKFFGGLIGIGSWFITYQVWYKTFDFSPGEPGSEMSVFIKSRGRKV